MITAALQRSSIRPLGFPVVLAVLMLMLAAGGDPVRELLGYSREAVAAGQVWRLLTANLVHLGWYHAALNLLGLLALLVLCPERPTALAWMLRLVVLGLGVTLGLYVAVPDLGRYVGFSGVLHGLFLLGLVPMVRRGDLIAAGCLAYLLAKLGWEWWIGAPVSDSEHIGGRVVTESHLLGTLAALVYGLLAATFKNIRGEPEST